MFAISQESDALLMRLHGHYVFGEAHGADVDCPPPMAGAN
jgi:hypothetical protein